MGDGSVGLWRVACEESGCVGVAVDGSAKPCASGSRRADADGTAVDGVVAAVSAGFSFDGVAGAARRSADSSAAVAARGVDVVDATVVTFAVSVGAMTFPAWRTAGYRVVIFFLELPSEELAVQRVADRVAQGGHDIPEPVIRRRFTAGRENFARLYKALADEWKHFDNAGDEPILLASSSPDL